MLETIRLYSTGWNTSGLFSTLGTNRVFIDANGTLSGMVLNTEIGTPIMFATANTERMRVQGNGNVGIGVTSPVAKLDVQGSSGSTIKIVDGNQGANKVLTSDAAGVGSWQSLSAIGGTCFQNSYCYTANGTWTCPAGVTKAFVEIWGAGGGGYQGGAVERNGGGGGGSYAAGYVTVVPATGYAVVVGTGGATNAAGGTS